MTAPNLDNQKGPPKVEMHRAYVWTCDSCGRDNLAFAALVEECNDKGKWRMSEIRPQYVVCAHCGSVYEGVVVE